MKDSVRALAAEFKQFLSTREEDDLLPAACSQAAAHISESSASSSTHAPAQDHLTIEFAREKKARSPLSSTPVQTEAKASVSAPTEPAQAPTSSLEATMSAADKKTLLEQIAQEIQTCQRCPLGATRLNAVPGEGNPCAELMFVGEKGNWPE